VAATLLALIVIALMAVFNGTQKAFRAGLTQTDVLESGRATMDLIAADLRAMVPSLDVSNGAVNFSCQLESTNQPLVQTLVATSPAVGRTNVLESFFILSRGNQNGVPTWFGTGYAVFVTPTNFYSLYRFSSNCPVASGGAINLIYSFTNSSPFTVTNGWSHLMDGVVSLQVRAYDTNGVCLNQADASGNSDYTNADNVLFIPNPTSPFNFAGVEETGFYMFSNTLPAAVQIEMGVLEDQIVQRAESLGNSSQSPWNDTVQWNYLEGQAGAVHVFRQRVTIPQFDPSPYQ